MAISQSHASSPQFTEFVGDVLQQTPNFGDVDARREHVRLHLRHELTQLRLA